MRPVPLLLRCLYWIHLATVLHPCRPLMPSAQAVMAQRQRKVAAAAFDFARLPLPLLPLWVETDAEEERSEREPATHRWVLVQASGASVL